MASATLSASAAEAEMEADARMQVGCFTTPYSAIGAFGYIMAIFMVTAPFWLVGLFLVTNSKNDTEEDLGTALTIIGFVINGPLFLFFMYKWLQRRGQGPPPKEVDLEESEQ